MPEEMMRLPEEMEEMERMLAGLKPVRAVDRDRVLFEAGRLAAVRAGRVRQRFWQGACGVLLGAACVLLAGFPRVETVERLGVKGVAREAVSPVPVAPAPEAAVQEGYSTGVIRVADGSYLELRQRVLSAGMAALAPARGNSADGAAMVPSLRRGEGIEALAPWQRHGAGNAIGG